MIRPTLPRVFRVVARCIHSGSSPATSHNRKYADKLLQKAQEKGLDLEELKSQAREKALCKQREEAAAFVASMASCKKARTGHANTSEGAGTRPSDTRRDGSPVKPLSSILNLSKLVATPHTPSQISALWTAYHASRTSGTGRGYICASLPLETYNAMTRVAKKYPVFVVPVPRGSASENTSPAQEFFFLQWDFHPAPPVPSAADPNPFEPIKSGLSSHLPEPCTVLFTPLQEYKHRTSFATPYLVLTFYTDISESHGIVLLRGEITPSPSAAVHSGKEIPERFLLSQVDAQLLAMRLQRFYLWRGDRKDGDHDSTAEVLLKRFHEEPDKFSWEDLLESSNIIA